MAAAVPVPDQILLLGPPYKVPKDSILRSEETLSALRLGDLEDDPNYHGGSDNSDTNKDGTSNDDIPPMLSLEPKISPRTRRKSILQTTERTGARRLFLFSKQSLSESGPEPTPCHLTPMEIELPTDPGPSPLVFLPESPATDQDAAVAAADGKSQQSHTTVTAATQISPLHQALSVYERRFMLHLCRGRSLADGADLRLSACRACVAEQAVMARALRAAVSNVSDNRNKAARTRGEVASTFSKKTGSHSSILQSFEILLNNLKDEPLHPELITIARSNGRVMETLLDTVPVERMRVWANQCQISHKRLLGYFKEMDQEFESLGTPASREEEVKLDMEAEDRIKSLSEEVEDTMTELRDLQATRLATLTSDHKKVVSIVMNAISDGEKAQDAFSSLEAMSKASTDVLPSMVADDKKLMEIMTKVADAKTMVMKRMKQRLRQISVAQSTSQRVLQQVAVLKDALVQQCEYMAHVEHIVELPDAYRAFLSEIRRRRAYCEAVSSASTAMVERLSSMQKDEEKFRMKFLRGPGKHLMPNFFDMFVPTLATSPPLITPQVPVIHELDTLPQFGPERGDALMRQKTDETPVHGNFSTETPGVSDASSLTESLSNQMTEKADLSTSGKTNDKEEHHDETTETPSLLESVEGSGNNSATKIDMKKAEDDADRKALIYENSVLRGELQRLGGKSPSTYVQIAREKESEREISITEKTKPLEIEIARLRKELANTNSKLSQTSEALMEAKKNEDGKVCDKISHSSFSVGDLALFMPVLRSGGKKIYLAFHRNCPHRYLSTDSIDGNPDYVLGRIVYQDELIAGASGTETNPHGLPVGTKFWILTVESLT